MRRIKVVDSHTGGEPTRVVVDGLPDLGKGSLAERRERFGREFDRFRSACVNEPRASEVIVGALLVEPAEPGCAAGVIYFNNVGTIGMCGHGTIGLMITLAHLGRIKPGEHRIDTPVGVVSASLSSDGQVTVTNVASWREKKDVTVEVPGLGRITGDIAWGGNRFFLVEKHSEKLTLDNVEHLTDVSWRIRHERRALAQFRALSRQGLRPLSLRHRHERQACLPRCRRQARRGRELGAGEHRRQPLRGFLQVARSRRRQGGAAHLGHRIHHRGEHAAPG
jgi:4-hydroxyproline epimerase